MAKKVKKLTDREERFLVEYSICLNATEAAKLAGYSEKTAHVTGHKILARPHIKKHLAKIKQRDEKRYDLKKEEVIKELAKGVFRDPIGMEGADGFVVTKLSDIPKDLRMIIDGMEVKQFYTREGELDYQTIKVKFIPKANAIDMAMKHLGAYAAEQHEGKLSFDWDSLYDRAPINDPIEADIKKLENKKGND